jgi:PAP_fibrillin
VVFDRSIVGLQSLLNYQNASSWLDRVREAVVTGKKFTALDLAINAGDRGAWLEIIYLDADLRIGRGNEGNIFILERVD